MRNFGWLSAVWLAGLASAEDVVYVVDLEIFTLLAPCAAKAITYAVDKQTVGTRCGGDESELQSCLCSNTGVHDDLSFTVSAGVKENCGTSASDDVFSASKVLDKYCDPGAQITFSTPTTNAVEAYITDISELDYLAPCAQTGVTGAIVGASTHCPSDASLYAPCVCSKSDVLESVQETMSSLVRNGCDNGEDVTSATAFFSDYCAMNNGTTSFAPPGSPPGDMSYYITALPQFKALQSCARDAVSGIVQSQTDDRCPSGPQALASCACIKSGISYDISSALTSSVKFRCDNPGTDDVNSAADVFKEYCSAANNDVVPEVTESVPQSYPFASTGSGSGDGVPKETGGGGGEGGGDDGGGGGGVSLTATIAASVLGGIVGIAIIAAVIIFLRRRAMLKKRAGRAAGGSGSGYEGKPELASDASGIARPDTGKETVTDGGGQQSELQGGEVPLPPGHPPQELNAPGYDYRPPPQQHFGDPALYEAPAAMPQPRGPLDGGEHSPGWQAGPVEMYELDSHPGKPRERKM